MGSFVDKQGNHVEMGLHVFFGCYNNLFRLLKKVKLDLFYICTQFVGQTSKKLEIIMPVYISRKTILLINWPVIDLIHYSL